MFSIHSVCACVVWPTIRSNCATCVLLLRTHKQAHTFAFIHTSRTHTNACMCIA